ncbi:MAG: hypothetical protein PHR77_03965 [Kiritimatiellae bacterium]|nr:hypothetical protein [Kiritimatiellia bacterium]MDD5519941.1 hypothetical protein [Kiritimatiellia bacterium]
MPSKINYFYCTILISCLVSLNWLWAEVSHDTDSDGIPDEIEKRLGTDPSKSETRKLLWESTAPAGGADRGEAYLQSRDLRKLFVANVASNRYLWVLEFAGNYEIANNNLLVYVDADNNPKFGQRNNKDLAGTDFVLWLSDGGRCCHAYGITGEGSTPAPTRFAMLGKNVFICTDMNLAQEAGESKFRVMARCERLEPRTQVSDTGWVIASCPPQSVGNKPPIMAVKDEVPITTDSDNDGLPDGIEERLGTDPKAPEQLAVIFDALQAKDAESRKKKFSKIPERAISRILFGNVAGDRFLWCIEFGADYPEAKSNFILYVDADNDSKTGRKGMGVEYMLGMHDGSSGTTAFAPDGQNISSSSTRAAIVGKRLYLCADVSLKQENGQSVYRVSGLSETVDPAKGVDSTPTFDVKSAGISERKKAFGLDDCMACEGVGMTRGLDLFHTLKSDTDNVVVKIGNCAFEAFEDDLRSEFNEPSALRTAPGGKIYVTIPKAGKFHFGFLLYDQAGTERIEIRRGNVRLGIAVADEDDNRAKLFFTKEAYDFKAGEVVELRSARASGNYRVEDILLLAKTPKIRPRVLELTNLEVTPVWDSDAVKPGIARVTWITTWPAKCTIKCEDRLVTEPEAVANHRIYLEGLAVGEKFTLEVTAPKPRDTGTITEKITFKTKVPKVKSSTKSETVPLTVMNPSVDVLSQWPVTCGIPFPQGALDSVGHIRLLAPNGNEQSLQTASQVRWPDGSVKWALLSFRADVPSSNSTAYVFEYGGKVNPAPCQKGLSVDESGGNVVVTTGPLRLEIGRKSFALPGKVWLDKNGNGTFTNEELVYGGKQGVGTLVDTTGKEFTTHGVPDDVIVEERGPERAVILVKGHHVGQNDSKCFTYEARIMAYAGQKFVRIFYTFGNDVTASDFTSVKSLCLAFPLDGGAERFEIGSGETVIGDVKSAPYLFQDFDNHFSLTRDGKTTDGKRAPGWVRVSGPLGTMTVAVRDFWQLYPKALSVDDGGIKVGLMPPLKEDQYAEASKDATQLVHLYYNLQDGCYKVKQGQTKTHEIMLSFEQAPDKTCLDVFQQGVAAVAPSAWMCGSMALGEVPPTGTVWSSRFDAQMATGVVSFLTARDRRRDYGMMNHGDWWGERVFNWGDIEYDDAHVWMIHFARTGDMRALTAGDRAAKHYGDVDCVHYSSDARRVGAGYSHCIGHVGGFFKTRPVDGGTLGGGHSPSHTRTEGLVEHYLLTGDRRSMDAALGIANHYGDWFLNNYDYANCRVPGWHLVLTMSLYNATADPFYLNVARIITQRVIERQAPGGGWQRNMVPGHCFCLPRHRGEAGFMVGVLLDGLKYYHQATGDRRGADAMIGGARYLIRETYDFSAKQFRYTTCPYSPKPSSTGNMACEGFAYAARLTRDKELRKVTREVLEDIIKRANGGTTSAVRYAPRALWDLDRMGELP